MLRIILWGLALILLTLNILIFSGVMPLDNIQVVEEKTNTKLAEPYNQTPEATESKNAQFFVPILMYHYIKDYNNPSDPLGVQLSVSPATLEKQFELIKILGYQPITLQDFAAKKYTNNSIILTFDDGYIDHYTNALPLLQKYNYRASFFIVSSFVGRSGYMNANQIQELVDAGMEVGGHSISHKNLASLSFEDAIYDISTSIRNRELVFAYPSGKYSEQTLDIVSSLGIVASVTTNLGVATEKSNLQELPRIRVKEYTDLTKRINEEIAIAKSTLKPSQRSKD
ncbi:polysaccharide deacetylase family protein [Candidatus Berkelbacteria bacterium]|nr:polysaccharide deacetylase family protein [Candidatus Berkelbacteria bacterium]